MLDWQRHRKLCIFIKITSVVLILSLLFSYPFFTAQSVFAQTVALNLLSHKTELNNPSFVENPDLFHLRYLYYEPQNKDFKVLLDKGDSQGIRNSFAKKTARELITYFLIGLALPNSSFWVNLRPDSPDNIIDDYLARTDAGGVLLEADLHLKEDVAKLTSPSTPEGMEYWDKLYKKAGELFGSENVTIPTLTRPWIVPDEIITRESQNHLYIYKATLKVMLEQDYLKGSAVYSFNDEKLKEINEYSSQLIRELIIPRITREINSSARYGSLRKVYYSLIFAQWFKEAFAGGGDTYSASIDKRNLTGLTSKTGWSKEDYFKAYQDSFKNGEYNARESIYSPFGQTIRSYFSGGVALQSVPRKALPAASPVSEAPEYTILAGINGNPQDFNLAVGIVAEPEDIISFPSEDLTPAQELTELFGGNVSDEQIQLQALRILKTAFEQESLSAIPQEVRIKALRVARRLYQRPDTKSKELAEMFGLTKDELINIYRLLRTSDTLQNVISTEVDRNTSASGFIEYAMKKLLRYAGRLERIFDRQVVYPVVVEWHPGETCDSNCIFCYSKGLHYQDEKTGNSGRDPLSLERAKELLKEFIDNGVREFWVSGGKEPLTSPNTADAIQYATDLGLDTRLYTNGIRMDRYVQERILGCTQIRISLNAATPETYQQVQGINGDNFNRVVQNIGDLVKLKKERGASVNIGMSFVLNPYNYKEIVKIADIAGFLGVNFLAIRAEQVGTIRKFSAEEIEDILRSVEALRINRDSGVYGDMALDIRSLTREDLTSEKHYYPNMEKAKTCQVRTLKIGMSPYGVCYMCEYAEHPRNARPELEIGDASRISFRELLQKSNQIKHDPADCKACMINEYGLNIGLEKLRMDKEFGIPLEEQPYRVTREDEIPYKADNGNIADKMILPPETSSSSIEEASPREEYPSKTGGVDFRRLPRSKAIKALKIEDAGITEFDIENLKNDLRAIENLINAGITPSGGRIRDCFKTAVHADTIYSKRLQRCIIDTLRLQEKKDESTEESLEDILGFLEQTGIFP
ncbi:MAG: radical SAM protein [Candidatus Omnitrophota bacterium]|nr:radical SAM protein [Candidatus Omnitrophota bacterium]